MLEYLKRILCINTQHNHFYSDKTKMRRAERRWRRAGGQAVNGCDGQATDAVYSAEAAEVAVDVKECGRCEGRRADQLVPMCGGKDHADAHAPLRQ